MQLHQNNKKAVETRFLDRFFVEITVVEESAVSHLVKDFITVMLFSYAVGEEWSY